MFCMWCLTQCSSSLQGELHSEVHDSMIVLPHFEPAPQVSYMYYLNRRFQHMQYVIMPPTYDSCYAWQLGTRISKKASLLMHHQCCSYSNWKRDATGRCCDAVQGIDLFGQVIPHAPTDRVSCMHCDWEGAASRCFSLQSRLDSSKDPVLHPPHELSCQSVLSVLGLQ